MNQYRKGDIVVQSGRYMQHLDASNGIYPGVDYVVRENFSGDDGELIELQRVDGKPFKYNGSDGMCCSGRIKLKEAPVAKFDKGDVVIVIHSPHSKIPEGAELTVNNVSGGGESQSIQILNLNGVLEWWAARRFKLKDEPRGRAWPGQWLKNEVLICIEPGGNSDLTAGKEYVVLEDMDKREKNNVYVNNDLGERRGLFPNRFKLKETETMTATNIPASQAKVGDTVLVEGKLTRGPDGEGDFAILFEGKTDNQFVPAKAVRQIVKRPPPEPNFKLEAKVKMDPSNYNFDRYKRGIVKGHDNGTYFVKWDNGSYTTVSEKNLRAA